jgi:hypothetical protein
MGPVIALALLAGVLTLAVAALLGRVQARSSCAVADPRRDVPMRAAFDEGNEGRPEATRSG